MPETSVQKMTRRGLPKPPSATFATACGVPRSRLQICLVRGAPVLVCLRSSRVFEACLQPAVVRRMFEASFSSNLLAMLPAVEDLRRQTYGLHFRRSGQKLAMWP